MSEPKLVTRTLAKPLVQEGKRHEVGEKVTLSTEQVRRLEEQGQFVSTASASRKGGSHVEDRA